MCILSCSTSSIANCKTCTYSADNFLPTGVVNTTVRITRLKETNVLELCYAYFSVLTFPNLFSFPHGFLSSKEK